VSLGWRRSLLSRLLVADGPSEGSGVDESAVSSRLFTLVWFGPVGTRDEQQLALVRMDAR
jgi:hypothetical protein